MRYHAHLGMLPLGAFEHCGDKRIKPQGGGGIPIISDVVDVVSDIGGGILDVGGDIIEGVGDLGQDVIDVVDDAGHWIDDKVNEEIPGGWGTVAAVTAATMGVPTDFGLGEAAAAEAAGTAAATETGLATLPSSVLGADAAFATGSELAAGLETAAPWGISAGAPAAEFGTFNPATISGIGADTSALGGMEWLGGAGTLAEGTAGLTAEQIANAGLAGSVGSNAASGLGYLGGAESLPSGTAGITGVTSTPIMDSLSNIGKSALDALGTGQQSGSNTAYLLAKGLSGGQENMPIGYSMNKNPFAYTQSTPIQSVDPMKNLADLLRKS